MPALVISKFEEELIKIECANMETPFSHNESMEIFFDAQGHVTPKPAIRYGQNSNSSKNLCLSWLPASFTKIRSKVKATAWRYGFSHYKSMGALCCHGNHSFDGICSKT